MSSTFGVEFRVTTWGESHGPAVGVVVDGCPSRVPLSRDDVQRELDLRRPGGELHSPRAERDEVEILSGIFEGMTTGAPICMMVRNVDVRSEDYEGIKDLARPGHADLTYELKYKIRDWRGGGRASARETVGRVAAGAVAKKILRMHGIEVIGYVRRIADVEASIDPEKIVEFSSKIRSSPVRCFDDDAERKMIERIEEARRNGDSVGGVVEIIALGVPPGLGEPIFDKLDADLAKGLMSIPAVKGVEIGAGFEITKMRGSEANDQLSIRNGKIVSRTNRAGGILGGISNGMPIVARIAIKPTSSIAIEQETVNLRKMREERIRVVGRHDPCIAPRAVAVAEAMVAIVLADHGIRSGLIPRVAGG